MRILAPYIAAFALACMGGYPAASMTKAGLERGTQVLQDAMDGRVPQ